MFVNVVFSTACMSYLGKQASKSNCVGLVCLRQTQLKCAAHYRLNELVSFKYLTIDSLYDFNIEYCYLDLILDLVLVQNNWS